MTTDETARIAVPAQVGPPALERTAVPQVTPASQPSRAPTVTGLDRPAVVALAIGALGVVLRLVLTLLEVPASNSDEAVMGLAAIHIAEGSDFPVFFYGQNYMGTIEAFLAAPIVAAFGPSVLALRIPTLLMYVAFVCLAYRLTRRLYTPWLAVLTVAVLALGSMRVVKNQLFAGGGYPEISPLAVGLFLLALAPPRRLTAGAFGFILGLLFWDDWIIAPYAVAAVAVFYVQYRGERGLFKVAGVWAVVGALPWTSNFFDPIGHYGPAAGLEPHLYEGMLLGVPWGMGMCAPESCAPWQMWWGIAYPVLLIAAFVVTLRALRSPRVKELAATDPTEAAERIARFGLVAAAAFTAVMYLRSNRAGETVTLDSSRYLSTVLISTPAILSVLLLRPAGRVWPRWRSWAGGAVVAGMLATMFVATAQLVAATPEQSRHSDRVGALVAGLEAHGIDRIYSEYWSCNLITYTSDKRVICANVEADLSPGIEQELPFRQIVEAAGDAARYVAPVGHPLDERLRDTRTLELTFDGFNVYR